MSSSALVVKVRYSTTNNVRTACKKWGKYANDKKKADPMKIDKTNFLNDYMNYTNDEVFTDEKSESFCWSTNGDINCLEDIKANPKLDRKGIVWDMVLSFTPEFSLSNGLVTKQDFYKMTLNVMPSFLTEMGFKIDNTSWYAVLHRNTKHPHLHILFYEHNPTINFKAIPKNHIVKLKSKVSNYILKNEEFYIKRDKEFQNITGLVSIEQLTKLRQRNFFDDKFRKELNKMLLELYNQLPKKGRLQYNSRNMNPYRNLLDNIIDFILKSDNIKYSYENYYRMLIDYQKKLTAVYGNSDANKNNKYVEEQLNKLYSKIGNDILTNFKVYNSMKAIEKEKEFLKKHIMEMKFKSQSYSKEKTKLECARGLFILSRMANLNDVETKKLFDNWIKNSGYLMNSQLLISSLYDTKTEISTTDFYKYLSKLNYSYERYSKLKNKYFYQELSYRKMINRAIDSLVAEIEREKEKIIEEQRYELETNY